MGGHSSSICTGGGGCRNEPDRLCATVSSGTVWSIATHAERVGEPTGLAQMRAGNDAVPSARARACDGITAVLVTRKHVVFDA